MFKGSVSRVVVIVAVIAALLSSFGCAGQAPSPTPAPPAKKEAATPAAAPKSEPAAKVESKAPIKLGYVAPMTGVAAELGIEVRRGVELAVDEINAQGGLDGHKIEIIVEDDQADPAKGVAAFQKLISRDNVDAVIGSAHSAVSLAAMEVTKAAKIVQISPTNSLDRLTEIGNPYYFRVSSKDSDFAKLIAEYAAQKYQNIAILHDTTAWGQGGRDAYVKALAAYGKQPVTIQSFEMGAPDHMPQVLNMQKAGADAVIIQAQGADAAQTLKTLRQINYAPKVIGHPGLALRTFANLTKELGEGTVIFDGWDSEKPQAKKLIEAYKKKYNNEEPFAHFPALGYDTVMILARALKDAGYDKTKLKDAMERIKDYEGVSGQVGAKITFSAESHDGYGPKGPVAKVLQGGKLVPLK